VRLPPRQYAQRELIYVAIARVLACPLTIGLFVVADEPIHGVLAAIVISAFFYTGGLLALAVSPHWNRVHALWFVPLDLLVLGIAVAASDGPASEVQVIFYVWTIAMALLYQPRQVLACLLAAMATYAAVSVPFIIEDGAIAEQQLRELGLVELGLAWIGLVTYFVSDAFARRSHRIGALSEARQRLLADALSAEDRARRRLSQSLHDDTLQVMLAVGQDLSTGLHGDTRLLTRAREELRTAVRDLRETIRGLHPAALEHGGLAGGLDAVVERAGRYGGFAVDLRVDPAASGPHDSLVVSLIRELVTNAAKHSEASKLSVQVVRERAKLRFEVADDGRGMTEAARDTALGAGHIGLASCAERVDAAGGTMRINSSADRGTTIVVELPAERLASSNGRPQISEDGAEAPAVARAAAPEPVESPDPSGG
jgi:two-component system NarL family sensor kinase